MGDTQPGSVSHRSLNSIDFSCLALYRSQLGLIGVGRSGYTVINEAGKCGSL